MSYTKTDWKDKSKPSINSENLNKLESGVYQAHELGAENRAKIEELLKIAEEFTSLKEKILLIIN